jgi:hypothetical protein
MIEFESRANPCAPTVYVDKLAGAAIWAVGLDSDGGTSPRMPLILRTMKKHIGWEDAKDDYVVLDGEKSAGRIYIQGTW